MSLDDVNSAPDALPGDLGTVIDGLELTLRRALVARFGVEVGVETTQDALAWAWEHRQQVTNADNPSGLLFRVAQSKSRRYLRWRRRIELPPERAHQDLLEFEPGLHTALQRLNPERRTAVVLVHAYRYSYRDAANAIGVPESTIRNHVHRGLAQLRDELEN